MNLARQFVSCYCGRPLIVPIDLGSNFEAAEKTISLLDCFAFDTLSQKNHFDRIKTQQKNMKDLFTSAYIPMKVVRLEVDFELVMKWPTVVVVIDWAVYDDERPTFARINHSGVVAMIAVYFVGGLVPVRTLQCLLVLGLARVLNSLDTRFEDVKETLGNKTKNFIGNCFGLKRCAL